MPIRFHCPRCKKEFAAPEDLAGKTVACDGCGAVLRIPGQAVQEVAATPQEVFGSVRGVRGSIVQKRLSAMVPMAMAGVGAMAVLIALATYVASAAVLLGVVAAGLAVVLGVIAAAMLWHMGHGIQSVSSAALAVLALGALALLIFTRTGLLY